MGIRALMEVPNYLYNRLIVAYKMNKNPESKVGKNFQIRGRIRLHGDGTIIIGDHVRINSSEQSNPIGGADYTIIVVDVPGKIVIHDHVGISNTAIVCRNSVTIETNVKIGGGVKIYDTDFHALNSKMRNSERDRSEAKDAPITIRESAFIGAHSIILKGVTIGEGAIVGAGSVVTKSIGDYEVWAGNPARFIKKIE